MEGPPPEKKEAIVIQVKLVPQDGSDPLEIKAKASTPVQRLIDAYAKEKGIDGNQLRLFLDGKRLSPGQNLGQTEVQNGDQIDVAIEQIGG